MTPAAAATHQKVLPTAHFTEIDGLRAIAVLSIVLFHFDVHLIQGGFVGVDIFFVISGFLITRLIILQGAHFRITDFWERRLRRIFPALAAMLLCVLCISYFVMLPQELVQLSKYVVASILLIPNVMFWQDTGYFAPAAEENVLLHLWSLGVEEQFYIALPIALFGLNRLRRVWQMPLVAALAILSYGLSAGLTASHPSAAFFLLPTRAWEMLIGSLLAFGAAPAMSSLIAREAIALVGAFAIATAVLLFDQHTVFPGVLAAIPVVGAALIIAYSEGTYVGRVLSWRPLVMIGLLSYSLYLWHWPVSVFGKMLGLDRDVIPFAIGGTLLSLALAFISWRFIELPFRNRNAVSRRSMLKCSGAATFAILSVVSFLLVSEGGRNRFSPAALALIDGREDYSPTRYRCHIDAGLPDLVSLCVFGGAAPTSALWADSHGVELASALGSKENPVLSVTSSSCPPAQGLDVPTRRNCKEWNRRVLEYLLHSSQIRTVILAADFQRSEDFMPFATGMKRTVEALVRRGKRVVLIGPTPGESRASLRTRVRDVERGNVAVSKAKVRVQFRQAYGLLVVLERAGAKTIDPADHFCTNDVCPLVQKGRPVLFDSHHLSMSSAASFAIRIRAEIWPNGIHLDTRRHPHAST